MTKRAPTLRIAVAILAALVVVPAAFAAKGGKGNGAGNSTSDPTSFSLAMVNDVNGDGLPNYGDSVTFNVSTTVTAYPYVYLNCSQGGVSVYNSSYLIGFYPGFAWPWLQTITLSSQTWTGGAAGCTATLAYFDGKQGLTTITTRNFNVAA